MEEEMMIKSISKFGLRAALLTAFAAVFALPSLQNADAHSKSRELKAKLSGFQEPPAVSSTGKGTFRALISRDRTSIEYILKYEGMEGDVTQAHIHVGQVGVNGGITLWLCGTTIATPPNPGPAGTPVCPGLREGTVTRTLTAADVVGPATQGIAVGEFEEVLKAIESGVTYANVHSLRNAGGEIRGQIRNGDDDDDDDHH
jgi:hypothetical protein